MRFQFPVRAFAGLCMGVALLSGCSGSRSYASIVPAAVAAHQRSAQSGPLLYVVGAKAVYVLDYPSGQMVATIQEQGYAACSDKKGNVFIAGDHGLDEFSHGGTKVVAHLILPYTTNGCSFDPTTQTLAATNGGYVALFPHEQNPAVEYSSGFGASECGYDDKGNLYVDGYAFPSVFSLAVQPRGKLNYQQITLPASLAATPGQVQWDGKYITIESGVGVPNGLHVYRLSVDATYKAKVMGTVSFKPASINGGLSWIHTATSSIIVPFQIGNTSTTSSLGYWKYPAGGAPTKTMNKKFGSKSGALYAVTLSVPGT